MRSITVCSRHVKVAQQHVILLWTADQPQRFRHTSRARDRKAGLFQRSSQSHAHNFIIVDEKYPNMVHLVSLIGTIGGYSSML
jgi:hypothetical protein